MHPWRRRAEPPNVFSKSNSGFCYLLKATRSSNRSLTINGTAWCPSHGKTVLNSSDDEERLRGWMDIPLNEQGLLEAEDTARRLAQYPVGHHLLLRPLPGAPDRGSCGQNHASAGHAYFRSAPLEPRHSGGTASKGSSALLTKLRTDPGCPSPGGEPFLQFCDRYLQGLKDLLEIAARSTKCIVAVTHVRNLLATPALQNDDRAQIPVRGGPRLVAGLGEKGSHGWHLRVGLNPDTVEHHR